MSDDRNYYHNQGEKDGAEGNYNPPNGIFSSFSRTQIEENEAYDKGYSHGKGQVDGSRNDYDSSYRGSNSYNSGWDNGYDSGGGSGSSSGCFITTATLNSIGKTDNCEELNKFRNFRDNWLSKQDDGNDLILEYYKIAPEIVKAINAKASAKEIYQELWNKKIKVCLEFINNNQFKEAKLIYCNVIINLKKKYLNNSI